MLLEALYFGCTHTVSQQAFSVVRMLTVLGLNGVFYLNWEFQKKMNLNPILKILSASTLH